MDTKTLQIFMKTVDYGNVTRVAEEFGITQPAVSAAIRRLEEDQGCALFIRRNKWLVPNEQGKIFYRSIAGMMKDFLHAVESIRGSYYRGDEIVINVRTPSDKLYSLMNGYLKGGRKAGFVLRPDSERSSADLPEDGLTLKLRQYVENEEYVPIDVQNLLYVVMNRSHPLSRSEQVQFSEIRNEDFVFIRSQTSTGYEQSYSECILAGIVPHVTLVVDSNYEKYAAIRRGEWIGVAYNHELTLAKRLEECAVIPMYAALHGKLICLTWHKDCITPAEEDFINYVSELRRRGDN
ncbi:MAG: LysR family transcriptional regulator [Solobacterium sp.]|nr:LysR family transcriptional regulator [Solobacterium sp.]